MHFLNLLMKSNLSINSLLFLVFINPVIFVYSVYCFNRL